MKSKEKTPPPPAEGEKEESVPANVETTTPAAEQPLDPKEEARLRSRADLERQRNRLRNKRGNF